MRRIGWVAAALLATACSSSSSTPPAAAPVADVEDAGGLPVDAGAEDSGVTGSSPRARATTRASS